MKTLCPKEKFRPLFQRWQFPKTASLVAPRTERNTCPYKSAGGEQKYSGGIFLCGEPSPGVPRCAPAVRAAARRIAAFTFCEKQPCPPDISFAVFLRARVEPRPYGLIKFSVGQKKRNVFANRLPESKISPAFSKAVESKGETFGRSAHGAKFFSLQKRRRGDETVRGTVLAWGTLAGGSPVRAGAQQIAAFT